MRISGLLTVAALVIARDCLRAQDASVMVQAIPVVTRASPSATRTTLTEGYLSQPMVMAHGERSWLRATATLNLEGLTIDRGELSTGGYGEGYVDRRHPHSYIHEALLGAVTRRANVDVSIFAGRGFVPFGSDDPMVRPFEKYPINHHLAQVLERLVTIVAVRRGPWLAEGATFDGDEPVSPSAPSSWRRFGDSWSSRLTLLPASGAELSASYARVKSPEVTAGGGLDQAKSSFVARFSRENERSSRYALAEYAHTAERDPEEVVTRLSSFLGEAGYCWNGISAAARVERTDRPEEERLLDPFRTPRPSVDLANLGVSRWTVVTGTLSAPAAAFSVVRARPFVEIARLSVAPGSPAGIFNPELRYGASKLWLLSAGVRLRAGSMHARMGRYGVAAPDMMSMGTHRGLPESDSGPGASHDDMPGMRMSNHSSNGKCVL